MRSKFQGRENSININFLVRISRGHSWPLRPDAQGSKSFSPPPRPQENTQLSWVLQAFVLSIWGVHSIVNSMGGGVKTLRIVNWLSHIFSTAGSFGSVQFWKGFWGRVLRRVLRRGAFFVGQKGFWEGFSEGVLRRVWIQKVPRTPPRRVRPLRRAPRPTWRKESVLSHSKGT